MNFILYLMIVLCFYFIGIMCKSIHVHDDYHSKNEVNEGKTLKHKSDSKSKVSWIKLKPILRREMQHIKHVKDTDSEILSADTTHQIPTNKEEKSSKISENEEIAFDSAPETDHDISTDIVKSNPTIMSIGDSNMLPKNLSETNVENLKLDSPVKKNDFPYNITPDIMNQSGDLIVFLAFNEDENKTRLGSNETMLINEGTIVPLEAISKTGLELLTDFETQQNSMEINNSILQRTLIAKDNLFNLIEDFNEVPLEMKSSEDAVLLKIPEEISTITDIAEISTGLSEMSNTEQILEHSVKDENDHLKERLNDMNFTDFKNQNNSGTNLTSTSSERKELQLITSDEKSNTPEISAVKTNRNETENTEPVPANLFKSGELTEVSAQRISRCPDPGLCIFWFLTVNTCDEDSQCPESLICCIWGCSKMCMVADSEMY